MSERGIVPSDVVEDVTRFIERVVRESGSSGVVVGLSGGIDSSVASALAARALDSGSVHGLVMPAASSDSTNITDARRHAESLGISYRETDVEPIVDAVVEAYPGSVEGVEARGNVRARSRMVLEYLDSNLNDRLVLGTGNRTELLLGYFTKYGDGGVDVLPIGGLYKTEVKELARYLEIDQEIIEKPPTAGLWEGQTDEGELGAPYPTVDRVLQLLVDEGQSVEEAAEEADVDTSVVERFNTMHAATEHKRKAPPYPEVTRN